VRTQTSAGVVASKGSASALGASADRMHFSGPPDMRVWVGAVDYVYGFGLCVEASSGWREGPAWRA
jgi:hypothetical protein